MWFAALLLLAPSLVLSLRGQPGGVCHAGGKQGLCVRLASCPQARRLMLERAIMPQICAFRGKLGYVCCVGKQTAVARRRGSLQEHGARAKQKCKEYSRLWHPGRPDYEDCVTQCRPDQGRRGPTPCVYHGVNVSALEFPHMAHLGFGRHARNLTWECGGSLISERFVLTAAHCRLNIPKTEVSHVRLGVDDPAAIHIFKVQKIFSHPDYRPPEKYNDIALLQLADKVHFSQHVSPACLQVERSFKHRADWGVVTGWGRTEHADHSDTLVKGRLFFRRHAVCVETYKRVSNRLSRGLEDQSMLCAGTAEVDTCTGDSGGPLQMTEPSHCACSIVGVTSFGIHCGLAPGVYTRVSYFVPWIESIVWPHEL